MSTRKLIVQGELFGNDLVAPATMSITYDPQGAGAIECTVLPVQEKGWREIFSEDSSGSVAGFKGSYGLLHDIEIPRFRTMAPISVMQPKAPIDGIAELYIEGDITELLQPVGTFFCYLIFPRTSLVTKLYSQRKDSLNAWREDDPSSMFWETPLGRAELIRATEIYGNAFGSDTSPVEVEEDGIRIAVSTGSQKTILEFVLELENTFEKATWLLSFLAKKRLPWYKAKIVYEPQPSINDRNRMIIVRRDVYLGREIPRLPFQREPDLLIDPRILTGGLFNEVIKTYETNPSQELFFDVILNLIVSNEDLFLEAHYSLIWTALEMMIDGLGKDIALTMSKSQFGKLRKKMEDLLKQEIHDPETLSNLTLKLSELQRVPVKWKFKKLIESYGLDLKDFWPKNIDNLDIAIDEMFSRRNEYVHRGQINDMKPNMDDIHRLRALISVWLLKILGYPLEKINHRDIDLQFSR